MFNCIPLFVIWTVYHCHYEVHWPLGQPSLRTGTTCRIVLWQQALPTHDLASIIP